MAALKETGEIQGELLLQSLVYGGSHYGKRKYINKACKSKDHKYLELYWFYAETLETDLKRDIPWLYRVYESGKAKLT